ncbi:MAG: methyl-accepting chemotaxis protein [Fretibacterium sp.]|nr:methyl-accepting chemotaxis protein [Fretibacterium sp.]
MFKNIRIAWKLLLGFGSVLLLFVLAVVLSRVRIVAVQEGNRFLGKLSDAMLLTGRLERNASALVLSIRGYRYTEDDSHLSEGQEQLEALKADLSAAKMLYQSNLELVFLKGVLEMEEPIEILMKGLKDVSAKTAEKQGDIAALADKRQLLQKHYQENIDLQCQNVEVELSNPEEMRRQISRIRLSEHMLFQVTEICRRFFAGTSNRDVKALEELYPQMDEIEKDITALLGDTRRQSVREVLEVLARAISEYFETLSDVIEDSTELVGLYAQLEPFGRELITKSAAASVEFQEWTKEAASDSERALRFAVWVLTALTIIAVLMGMAVALHIVRLISSPLRRIVLLADRVRGGDLTIVREDFQYEGRDELGRLSDSISEMIAAQRSAVRKVITLSNEVSESANALPGVVKQDNESVAEVQSSVEGGAELCKSNASELEESNADTEEMSAGAMMSTQSPTESSSITEFIVQTTNASDRAVSMVQSAIQDMESLHGKAQESGKKLSDLVGSVEKIGEFVDIITSLANQINLLASNTSIEAARAGDAGRGFAVVAKAVCKLAEESGAAAHQVQDHIETLQINAREAMDAGRESEGILETTLQKTEDAKGALADLMRQINNASGRIQSIAVVAEEQAAATREIASGIDLDPPQHGRGELDGTHSDIGGELGSGI